MGVINSNMSSGVQPFILKLRAKEYAVYTWLSIGIVYSLLCWPLLNSLCIIGLFVFWAVVTKKQLPVARGGKIALLAFISLYVVFILGMLYTANRSEGVSRLQQRLPLLLFPIIYGTSAVLDTTMLRRICLHFLAGTTLACLISLVVRLPEMLARGVGAIDSSRLFIFRDSYPYMIGLLCLTSIIIAFSRLETARRAERLALVASIVFLSSYLLLLSIRVVIALWMAVILVKTFRSIKSNTVRIAVAVVIFTSVIGGIAYIPKLNNQWKELTQLRNNTIPLDTDSSQGRSWGGGAIRIAIWESSQELVHEHWPAGVGTGDVQDSLQQAYRNHQFYFASEYNKYNAHNQYLQVLLSNGIFGVLALLSCILVPLFFIRTFIAPLDYALLLLIFALICLTEVILDINKGIVWYSFLNSIFAFSKSTDNSANINTYDR